MRRPPTRGPQDPWTPREIALCGHPCEPLPRRPTVDGPAHKVGLHDPYAGSRCTVCISMAVTRAVAHKVGSIAFTPLVSCGVAVLFTLREDQ